MLGRQNSDLRFLAVCADRTNLEAARMENAEQLLDSQRIPDDHFLNATASEGKPTVWDPYEFVDSVLDGKTGGGACVGNSGQLYYLEGFQEGRFSEHHRSSMKTRSPPRKSSKISNVKRGSRFTFFSRPTSPRTQPSLLPLSLSLSLSLS